MLLFKTMWGVERLEDPSNWPSIIQRIKDDGFDGVEFCVGPLNCFAADEALAMKLLGESGLKIVAQIHTCGIPQASANVDDHIASFKQLVLLATSYQPILINCHSGRDSWPLQTSIHFFKEVEAFIAEQKDKITMPVCHETHRTRVLYSPFVYRDLMAAGGLPPTLRINADLSHWVVVSERIFDDELDADFWPSVLIDLTKRCILVHARVGGSQTPQVMDPSDQANAENVAGHFKWWGALCEGMRARGVEAILEPEHGGDPYLARMPHTGQPLCDIWKVNTDLGKKLRKLFGKY